MIIFSGDASNDRSLFVFSLAPRARPAMPALPFPTKAERIMTKPTQMAY
jgi:hypothetical protein